MTHPPASPPFGLFKPTFEAKIPHEQPTKLFTPGFLHWSPTNYMHPISF